ncbi:hypothetical protein [Bowmanella yangjiangensis]|uniref:Uncharacterized protein n=1 Tax=Bowmanella yangjiangensis TaxID=2811230 RepID=A0ABS3CUR6_9ALTE|nr:hypothetical protein [Bowmanella yangjiangensis]MBN7819384.1 hypothetical protein [Bowmanella yangjiangensis]
MDEFEKLPLHDSVLESVELEWQTRGLILRLRVFSREHQASISACLLFSDCLDIHSTLEQPWGPSNLINHLKVDDGLFNIEMQSGDLIAIKAGSFQYHENAL